ncbi:MAG: hypothetical protein A2516_06850 [Alphaproteobacteria bacterium RIFOXYD12_FULL_60_8]|nr:MAG: hypothetical protein A2516_06850 [Alphaproteobacteria bacterium RIFOXYD12_FULL_60_8]
MTGARRGVTGKGGGTTMVIGWATGEATGEAGGEGGGGTGLAFDTLGTAGLALALGCASSVTGVSGATSGGIMGVAGTASCFRRFSFSRSLRFFLSRRLPEGAVSASAFDGAGISVGGGKGAFTLFGAGVVRTARSEVSGVRGMNTSVSTGANKGPPGARGALGGGAMTLFATVFFLGASGGFGGCARSSDLALCGGLSDFATGSAAINGAVARGIFSTAKGGGRSADDGFPFGNFKEWKTSDIKSSTRVQSAKGTLFACRSKDGND